MSGLDRILIDTDDLFYVRGLRDAVTQTYVNDATVELTLYDKKAADGGVPLAGMTWPLTLVYVAASNGDYQGTVEDTLIVPANYRGVAAIHIDGASLQRNLLLDVRFVTDDEDSLTWTSRKEIELLFGSDNIAQWADLNSTAVAVEITERIQWAVDNATDEARGRLINSPVKLSTLIEAPLRLRMATSRLAGVLLYESRGVKDTAEDDGKHKLVYHKKEANKFFAKVQAGQLRIGEGSSTSPGVVKSHRRHHHPTNSELGLDPSCPTFYVP